MATVGGNLFAPAPFGDFTVALLALDATVALQGGYGARETPIEEFLAGRDRDGGRPRARRSRSSGPPAPRRFAIARSRASSRKASSVLSLAAHVPSSGGRVAGARIAYGAMAPTADPRQGAPSARWKAGALDAAGIAAAVAAAAEGTSPPTDSLASAWYRREVVGVHLRRLLAGEP